MPTTDEIRAAAQTNASVMLKRAQERYASGDKNELLSAVYWCAVFNVEMPEWVTTAFKAAYVDVMWERRAKWIDVFGKEPRKGRKLTLAYQGELNRISDCVARHRAKGEPVDDALFYSVAVELGYGESGGSTVSKLHYANMKEEEELLARVREVNFSK